jgi:hypothetical protein
VKAYIRFLTAAILVLTAYTRVSSQTGGNNAYEFLNLSNSARIAAMGGNFLAVNDNDITLTQANPSLINPSMNNSLSLGFVDYYSDINYGFVMYGHEFRKAGSFIGSLQYISYGDFNLTNDQGEQQGNFNAGEYAFNVGWGRTLDTVFRIGANAKMILSNLESYNSIGVAVDVAGSYVPNDKTCFSLLFRNIGRQITTYSSNGVEPLPFEIQLGVSRKLEHLPFRFSLLLNHLERWDLTYDDPIELQALTGESSTRSGIGEFADKALRHVVIGGEFMPAKFLSLRLGYNYQRRQEMTIASRTGMVGFSWGLGLRVSKFGINYSRSRNHLSGSPNYITITTNLGDWAKKQ